MILEIKAMYHDGILAEVATRYGLAVEEIRFLKDMESFVFEFERDGSAYILKITHTLRRSPDYLMGELEWLNYLSDHGMTVCRAVPSANGQLIETVPAEEGHFLAIAYEKAPGGPIQPSDWNAELLQAWGRFVGRMHVLTQEYELSNPAYKRQEWYEEDMLNLRKYVPAEQTLLLENADKLMEKIKQLPRDRATYGLVHSDLHNGNFFWHQGNIYAFDFDDIGYNWFINDISKILYLAQCFPPEPYADKSEFCRHFLEHFLQGYRQEHQIDAWWIQHIPDFLRLRHLLMYGLFYQFFDLENLEDEQAEMLARYRQEIEQETPIVELDFMEFARILA